MNKFEATLLINPDLGNQALNKELESFKSTISKIKGKIVDSEDWGLRELTYKISNYNLKILSKTIKKLINIRKFNFNLNINYNNLII